MLKVVGVTAVSGFLGRFALAQGAPATPPASPVPPPRRSRAIHAAALGYAYDALEPFIDAQTMQIHHDKHHAAYVANLNKAISEMPRGLCGAAGPPAYRFARHDSRSPAHGHPKKRRRPRQPFPFLDAPEEERKRQARRQTRDAIAATFGDYDKFVDAFTKQALGVFGSGWAWLALSKDKKLVLESTPNQDSPLMHGDVRSWASMFGITPTTSITRSRADYIKAFCNVINWPTVEGRFAAA